ncbi:MAG: hypothetical protein NPIRA06_17610 [Nitrospirales bacterium]|nr:MAG: hypothetical protein NPIRA06_17610 [Nitrospirales bacterium]
MWNPARLFEVLTTQKSKHTGDHAPNSLLSPKHFDLRGRKPRIRPVDVCSTGKQAYLT